MGLFCKHDYYLSKFEQTNFSGSIISDLDFTCKKCGKLNKFSTTKLSLEDTNVSKSFLKREVDRLNSENGFLQADIIRLKETLKDQSANERIIKLYRPIVKNSKLMAMAILKTVLLEILENPDKNSADIIEESIKKLEEETSNNITE